MVKQVCSIFEASNLLAFLAQALAGRNRHASAWMKALFIDYHADESIRSWWQAVPNLELWADKASNPQIGNRRQEEGNKGSLRQLAASSFRSFETAKGRLW